MSTEILTKRGSVTVDDVYTSKYQKSGTVTAQLRQVVTKTYPSGRIDSNMQDNIFDSSDFDLAGGKSYDEQRVAFLDVPDKMSASDVVNQLSKYPEACIYRVMSYSPIIDDRQEAAINSGTIELDYIAEKQVVRNGQTGELILHEGNVQYRRTFFSKTAKEDSDLRDVANVYVPASLTSSSNSAMETSDVFGF